MAGPNDFSTLQQALTTLDPSSLQPAERRLLSITARQLSQRLEDPWERIQRLFWEEPMAIVSLKLGIDMGIFGVLEEAANGTAPQDPNTTRSASQTPSKGLTPTQIAARCNNADLDLTARLLRTISSVHAISLIPSQPETEPIYTSNPLTTTLTHPAATGTLAFLTETTLPVFSRLPSYFRKSAFKHNPRDPADCPWQWGTQSDLGYYQYLASRPAELRNFHAVLDSMPRATNSWLDFYPASERLVRGASADPSGPVMMLDLGGANGLELLKFARAFPDHPGKLVLQDLPAPLEDAHAELRSGPLKDKVTITPHDFMTEQPVRGARFYFLKSILHNHPDWLAVRILQNLRPALKKGYSKVVLHENVVVQEVGAGPEASEAAAEAGYALGAANDLVMMTLFGSRARTERDWRDVCGQAGFEVVGVWPNTRGIKGIVELEVRE